MKTFVNKRSELTTAKEALEAQGNNVFRTRMDCDCPTPKNRRYGVLAISKAGQLVASVIRCKTCTAIQGGASW